MKTRKSQKRKRILCFLLIFLLLYTGVQEPVRAGEVSDMPAEVTSDTDIESSETEEQNLAQENYESGTKEHDGVQESQNSSEKGKQSAETSEEESIKEETKETKTEETKTEETKEEQDEEQEEQLPVKQEELMPIAPFAGNTPGESAADANRYGQISLVKFKQFSNGCMGGMALDAAGKIWSFGYNLYGELGIGGTVENVTGVIAAPNYYGGMKRIPYFVNNNITITEIGSSYETRYALSDDGIVYAWGDGSTYQMGNNSYSTHNYTPQQVPGLPRIKHIFPSDAYLGQGACAALDENDELWVWGSNYPSGKLGTGGISNVGTPTKITIHPDFSDGTRKIVKVVIGEVSAKILDDKGDLWTCGTNANGEQGFGNTVLSNHNFVMIDRSESGMPRIIDVDTSYARLQDGGHDRTVVADENGDAWEWGRTYGDGIVANSAVIKMAPQKIVLDSAEVAEYGYQPKATVVTASEMVCYFIDQHGRPWGWGSGYYFGFGREGGYEDSNDELIRSAAAQQVPKIIGDGDTQIYDSSAKLPVYLGGDIRPTTRFGYGINALNDLHPTIYDEKYMLKDADGTVLSVDGERIKCVRAASADGVSGLTNGKYYKVDSSGKVIAPGIEAMPATDPDEKLWIDLAFKEVPYIAQMDCSLSAYAFIDADGNLFKWGNDGSGAIAWGWDYQNKYDQNGSTTSGLYDRYTYEVMYMRGAPTIDMIDIYAEKPQRKVYKTDDDDSRETATVTVHLPASYHSDSLLADLYSNVASLKYVFIPYDSGNNDFNIDVGELTDSEFMALYNNPAYTQKGELLSGELVSGTEARDETFTVDVTDNGRLILWGENLRYSQNAAGVREYERTDYVGASFVTDNFYTLASALHNGEGETASPPNEELYADTSDNVRKSNDDSQYVRISQKDLYGIPLDVSGAVIAEPTFGYDTVEIKSYEGASQPLPAGISPYWKFRETLSSGQPQDKEISVELDKADRISYTHTFLYERDLDYWINPKGEKLWSDMDNLLGLRPSAIELTLKQYERNTQTGAKGDFIQDIETIQVTPDEDQEWNFDFGLHKGYEYTYEVQERAVPGYETEVSYKTDVSGIIGMELTNTLAIKPIRMLKVDSDGTPITADKARFTLSNAEDSEKVLDSDGDEVSSLLLETNAQGSFDIPWQKPGTYKLTETKAPSGYNLLTKDVILEFDSEGNVTVSLGSVTLQPITLTGQEAGAYTCGYEIENKRSAKLPAAGGHGTYYLLFIGGGLMLLAVIAKRRKKKSTDRN